VGLSANKALPDGFMVLGRGHLDAASKVRSRSVGVAGLSRTAPTFHRDSCVIPFRKLSCATDGAFGMLIQPCQPTLAFAMKSSSFDVEKQVHRDLGFHNI